MLHCAWFELTDGGAQLGRRPIQGCHSAGGMDELVRYPLIRVIWRCGHLEDGNRFDVQAIELVTQLQGNSPMDSGKRFYSVYMTVGSPIPGTILKVAMPIIAPDSTS